jgi:cell division protein FtsW
MDLQHTDRRIGAPARTALLGDIDVVLFAVVIAFYGLGIVMVFSASVGVHPSDATYFLRRQLLWAAVSFTLFIICSFMDFSFLVRVIKPLVWAIIILLTLLLLPPFIEAGLVHQSRRWFRFGNVGFQPSEFAKIVILVYLSAILAKKGDGINDFYRGFLPPFIIVSLVSFLVFLEPDFSTAFILFFIALIMFFTAGIRTFSLISLIFVSIPALLLMVGGKGYRRERISGFLNPWADPTNKGYQIIQSFKAFAMGGLTGVGLGNSLQKMHHLPIPHTDFIFAILAEETGFVGVLAVVFLYMILAYRGFRIALAQRDGFFYYLSFGITCLIVWEAVFNIAVVTGLIPSTGISLPFLSYGGSSLLTNSILVGMLLSISRLSPPETEGMSLGGGQGGEGRRRVIRERTAREGGPRGHANGEE